MSWSRSRKQKRPRSSAVLQNEATWNCASRTLWASRPGSIDRARRKLSANRPVPTSATSASATSETTKAPRTRCSPALVVVDALCFRLSLRFARRQCIAGASPVRIAAPAHNSTAKPTISGWRLNSLLIGMLTGGISHASEPASHSDRPTPRRDAMAAINRLSVINCRTSRPGPAPIASRMPNSFCRTVARASCRLATFAATIRNSTTHTAIRIRRGFSSRACAPKCPSQTGIRAAAVALVGLRRGLRDAAARRPALRSSPARWSLPA